MTFENLNLITPILLAIKTKGYTAPTPIQAQAIPIILQGRDLLGCAQTGTGKTAAFAMPILQILHENRKIGRWPKGIKTLIITPTRELAIQIDESFAAYGKGTNLRHTVIFGGVRQHAQVRKLKAGVDILVATPGRLLDLMNPGFVNLSDLKIFTLDEADRMLDMGFIHDVKKIIAKLPPRRQTLFFSATMPPVITNLAEKLLTNPERIEISPVSSTADTVTQHLYMVEKGDKKSLLTHVLKNDEIPSALIFVRTKHGADKITKFINQSGVNAEAIHGNKSQNARQKALKNFKDKKTRVLVATDIAARGIDINELSHVINFEIPNEPETYIHRIGRTGRAEKSGIALSFCDRDEQKYLRDIHKLIDKKIPVIDEHPFHMKVAPLGMTPKSSRKPQHRRSQFSGNNRRRSFGQRR
ncbi:DEAD/DEAH box helicase [bacterium]|jgi:ATP-dependent RNA helicase RhlE|nr:DEAD/DEAH box helicase [bacterium]MBT6832255.1 DEAD/DEAH box helicase [bacterium]MBT6996192.1 DEAD/DEAH box helicase [bacterium]MBT7772439.1 DEAD/DEAH box helicase [bacterium]